MIQSLRRRLLTGLIKPDGELARLGRDEKGVTAIEFAMVIGPFLALLFAIMEVALVYFAQFSIDNAVQKAARLIRTGQAQTAGFGAATFKDQICSNVVGFIGCDSHLHVDVRSFPNFGAVTTPDPVDNAGNFNPGFEQYNMGNAGDVVLVTAFFQWDLMASMPKFGLGLGNLPNGHRLLTAGTAFRVEPFNQ